MLRILSWNIRQGGGSRLKAIKSYLNSTGAKIIVLSEFRNNLNGLNLRNSLLLNGYRYQAVSASKTEDNSVLVASKIPFSSEIYADIDPIYSGNIIKASFKAFDLYGCYLPHKKKHVLFDFMIDNLSKDRPTIIAGDLNSGINGLDQKGNSFWYEEKLLELEENEVTDLFRLKNGKIEEYSWISHQGNGYRYDHFYGSKDLIPIVTNCYYDHDSRLTGLSDHAAMFLELG
ncbi:endonuclease/exonuclease/phosphatase family protein [Portibacter lacus]|uniref:endonuclease/exonuclease/phosphatase family protein n=1 Tax=Portibacter lacus TaxID=1099794 RepID=UPI001F36B2E9|nr:endonuclease/exonuclease/phosphatase family protein [Portibacter lacus]